MGMGKWVQSGGWKTDPWGFFTGRLGRSTQKVHSYLAVRCKASLTIAWCYWTWNGWKQFL